MYTKDSSCGTAGFNDCTASLEEFVEKVRAGGLDDVDRFLKTNQPVYINKNCYLEGAGAFDRKRKISAVKRPQMLRSAGRKTAPIWK